LYERLFNDPHPDAGGKEFKAALNPESFKVVTAWLEPSLASTARETRFQFERHGYFVTDRVDHAEARPVFNRVTGLKDSFAK
jgi:glutaminyl-tRNA synthetase